MARSTKNFRVEKVVRDDFGKAIWVRISCFEPALIGGFLTEKFCHHVIFMPDGKGWVYIHHRISNNFIPLNRYMEMAKIAAAIFNEK